MEKEAEERSKFLIFNETVVELLHRYSFTFDYIQGKDVLDVASGEGYGTFQMSKHAKSCVGVDIDDLAIKNANANFSEKNLKFVKSSALNLPFEDSVFDVVVSFETIEHFIEHELFLKEIKRVLKPKGILIISTPDRTEYGIRRPEINPYHLKELTKIEFATLINQYFSLSQFYNQDFSYQSVIYPENNSVNRFDNIIFENNLLKNNSISKSHLFNIIIATDYILPNYHNVSIFNGNVLAP